jgi:hypothetical protein
MRVILLAAASALSLGVAGCAPRVDYASRTTLDCPERQGALERTGIAPDRKSCTYRGGDGAEVTLQLTPVSGDAMSTLSAIETGLVGPAGAKASTAAAGGETPEPPTPPKPPASPDDVAKAAAEAERDAHAGKDGADWDTGRHHGVTIERDGKNVVVGEDRDGDAHVNLPGLHIDADGENAKVDIGGIHVDANEDQATVRVFRDVRLRGQAFSREKNGLRATFIAKRDDLPDGYRFVGYEASGPKKGPLAVAIVKSRDEISHGGHMLRDLERLVRRNGGA